MTYNELINRFTIYDNPPSRKGFDRHHIVPVSEQTEPDNRQIYCSLPMHMWLHILYDKENGTNTAKRFLTICGKPIDYFDCWEKCLAYSYTLRKKREEQLKKSAEACRTPEFRQKIAKANRERTPEVIAKIIESQKGRIFTEEHKHKLAEAAKELWSQTEHRQKMSELKKGRNNPIYGTHRSEETKRKIANAKKGKPGIKGKKWWNNGVISVMAFECPEGFVPGRLYQRRTI